MSNQNSNSNEPTTRTTDEGTKVTQTHLRGEALNGSEQRTAADHVAYEKSRNPDTELYLDGEDDSLYNDGLDIGGD